MPDGSFATSPAAFVQGLAKLPIFTLREVMHSFLWPLFFESLLYSFNPKKVGLGCHWQGVCYCDHLPFSWLQKQN